MGVSSFGVGLVPATPLEVFAHFLPRALEQEEEEEEGKTLKDAKKKPQNFKRCKKKNVYWLS